MVSSGGRTRIRYHRGSGCALELGNMSPMNRVEIRVTAATVELRVDGVKRAEGPLELVPAELLRLEKQPEAYGRTLGEALFRDRGFDTSYQTTIRSIQASGANPRI